MLLSTSLSAGTQISPKRQEYRSVKRYPVPEISNDVPPRRGPEFGEIELIVIAGRYSTKTLSLVKSLPLVVTSTAANPGPVSLCGAIHVMQASEIQTAGTN